MYVILFWQSSCQVCFWKVKDMAFGCGHQVEYKLQTKQQNEQFHCSRSVLFIIVRNFVDVKSFVFHADMLWLWKRDGVLSILSKPHNNKDSSLLGSRKLQQTCEHTVRTAETRSVNDGLQLGFFYILCCLLFCCMAETVEFECVVLVTMSILWVLICTREFGL